MTLPFRPKVVHIGKYYWPVDGGVENHCYHLCRRLAEHADVTMICSNLAPRTEEDVIDGVRVIRVPRYANVASTPVSPGLYFRMRKCEADIIHVHLPNPMAELSWLLARPKGRLIAAYHSDIIKQKFLFRAYRPFNEAFLRRTDRIIAGAPQNIEHSPVLSKFKDRAVVIPYGIEPTDFDLTPERKPRVMELRERFGGRVIFFIGRHVYYKGIEYLIRAMKDVDAHAVIGSTGPLTDDLKALAGKLGVTSRVSFVGRISDEDLPCYYLASDIFCLPSIARSEAFGIVQLEAMAAGVSVVNTRLTTGMVYVNLDGVTGLSVPPEDPKALAAAFNRLFEDEALRLRLGRQARERVRSEFTHDINAERVLALYAELLGG